MKSLDHYLENHLEPLLWSSRYFIVISVLCSIIAAISLILVVGIIDGSHFISNVLSYLQISFDYSHSTESIVRLTNARNNLTFSLVEMIDSFLLSGVLFIFGFGLYELFISKISPASGSSPKGKILNIRDIDELKNKLAKVILMILIVKCFYYTVKLPQESFVSVIDITWLAGSIALIGLALYLSHNSQCYENEPDDTISSDLKNTSEK